MNIEYAILEGSSKDWMMVVIGWQVGSKPGSRNIWNVCDVVVAYIVFFWASTLIGDF